MGSAPRGAPLEGGVALAHDGSERAQKWRVGELTVALLDALPAQHQGRLVAFREPALKLGHEPGLTYARLPAEEDNRWCPGGRLTQR
jgi:hypothetical protein